MEKLSVQTDHAKQILADLSEHWPTKPNSHLFSWAKLIAFYLKDKTTAEDFVHRASLCLFIYFVEAKTIKLNSPQSTDLWWELLALISQLAQIAFPPEFSQAVQTHIDQMDALKERIAQIITETRQPNDP